MFDLVELFCRIDDFCKKFEVLWKSHLLSQGKSLPKRISALSMSEIITILVFFHFVRYRDFKTFYQNHLCIFFKKEFPHLVSYNQFVELKKRAIVPLYCFLFSLYGKCSGISFIDSTSLAVCHPKRIHTHQVFKHLAKRGKTIKEWFYGFKLHLVVNDQGELLGFQLTAGNVSDLAILSSLVEKLFGKLFGDKGYSVLQQAPFEMEEWWPSAIGFQEQVANYHKQLWAKAMVVSVMEKIQEMYQVRIKEMNTSELLLTCRKVQSMSKLDCVPIPRQAWKKPDDCPSDIRHKGSMNLIWAQIVNCRNLRWRCLTEKHKQRTCKAYSTEASSRDGATRSSTERVVMTREQRGCMIWSGLCINQSRSGRSAKA